MFYKSSYFKAWDLLLSLPVLAGAITMLVTDRHLEFI